MLHLLLSVATVLLLLRGWLWYLNRYEGPRTKQRQQQREPLRGLSAWGFVPVTNACALDDEAQRVPLAYLGQVRGYSVEAAFHWQTGWSHRPYYRIRAFFLPEAAVPGASASLSDASKRSLRLQSDENWVLAEAYADVRVPIGKFGHPTAAQLWAAANQLIGELNRLGMTPLDYREACQRLSAGNN